MSERTNALVGAELRRAREAVGLSQSALAAFLKLSRTSVTNIENGKQPISLNHLYLAAAVLGVRPGDLLPDIPGPARRQGRRSAEVTALLTRLEHPAPTPVP